MDMVNLRPWQRQKRTEIQQRENKPTNMKIKRYGVNVRETLLQHKKKKRGHLQFYWPPKGLQQVLNTCPCEKL